MKILSFVAAIVTCGALVFAQQPSTVNFNLVQVNRYDGQQAVQDSVNRPVQRITIDVNNPEMYRQLVKESPSGKLNVAPVVVTMETVVGAKADGIPLPWNTQKVLRSATGLDSFRVSSSQAGCPGTEIRPSVSVSFATPRGWSDPPIRFGPLNDHTVCALGKGYELEVSARGANGPSVNLRQHAEMYGRR
jgi:hypothetical protein